MPGRSLEPLAPDLGRQILDDSEQQATLARREHRLEKLVNGGDYRAEDIVGGDAVRKNGGEVRVLAFKPGRSTSALIAAIRRADD